jgi:hypothetical protein
MTKKDEFSNTFLPENGWQILEESSKPTAAVRFNRPFDADSVFVNSQTLLNGTIPSFQQLEELQSFFGNPFTIGDVRQFYCKIGCDALLRDTTWVEVITLTREHKNTAPKKDKSLINGLIFQAIKELDPDGRKNISTRTIRDFLKKKGIKFSHVSVSKHRIFKNYKEVCNPFK